MVKTVFLALFFVEDNLSLRLRRRWPLLSGTAGAPESSRGRLV
jgi:hypothetical protein